MEKSSKRPTHGGKAPPPPIENKYQKDPPFSEYFLYFLGVRGGGRPPTLAPSPAAPMISGISFINTALQY